MPHSKILGTTKCLENICSSAYLHFKTDLQCSITLIFIGINCFFFRINIVFLPKDSFLAGLEIIFNFYIYFEINDRNMHKTYEI